MPVSISPHCAIIQRFPPLVPVVSVQLRDDRGKTFASCSEQPRDGMVIYTNSGRIKKYRKLIVELLLAAHCRDCTTCVKSGECILRSWHIALACGISVLKIQENSTRSMTVHRPSSVIRTNVSSAATVYVPARNFRESGSWIRIPWNRGHGYACIQ